ncbi:MAG: winged helix-turn-helix domain-containing protein [Prevotella sp.]|jgi:transposase|nr:winged helix-turn-helix domain-containing protein [Prevotella sp.]
MQINLSPSEAQILERYRRNVPDRRSYVKVTCILMQGKGLSPKEVSEYPGIDESTVYRYGDSYLEDGLEGYLRNDYKGYWGTLSSVQISELRRELNSNLYTDAKSVSAWVKERRGIDYTPQGTVDLLNRSGFTYRQTEQVPCEVDVQALKDFMEVFSDILEQTTGSNAVIYYADGIERLWKFLRKKVINTCFYRTKVKFRQAILQFFENIEQYKPELETLLTLNFRLAKSQSNSF